MAMKDVPPFYYGTDFVDNSNNIGSASGTGLASATSGTKVAYIFRAPQSGFITAARIRTVTKTTNGNVDVRLETVDMTVTPAAPSGSLAGTNANVTVAITTANTWYTATFTTPLFVTQGQVLALVMVNSTGSYQFVTMANPNAGFPYSATWSGSAWTMSTNRTPVFLISYGGTFYQVQGILPQGDRTDVGTTSTPDEVGNKFTVPVGVRVIGFALGCDMDGDCDIVLYDASNTVLLTVSIDKDLRLTANTMGLTHMFSAKQELIANATYRLVYKPSTTTVVQVGYYPMASQAELGACPGGLDFVYTSRTDAGSWAENTSQQAMIYPYCDGIDSVQQGPNLIGDGMVS